MKTTEQEIKELKNRIITLENDIKRIVKVMEKMNDNTDKLTDVVKDLVS